MSGLPEPLPAPARLSVDDADRLALHFEPIHQRWREARPHAPAASSRPSATREREGERSGSNVHGDAIIAIGDVTSAGGPKPGDAVALDESAAPDAARSLRDAGPVETFAAPATEPHPPTERAPAAPSSECASSQGAPFLGEAATERGKAPAPASTPPETALHGGGALELGGGSLEPPHHAERSSGSPGAEHDAADDSVTNDAQSTVAGPPAGAAPLPDFARVALAAAAPSEPPRTQGRRRHAVRWLLLAATGVVAATSVYRTLYRGEPNAAAAAPATLPTDAARSAVSTPRTTPSPDDAASSATPPSAVAQAPAPSVVAEEAASSSENGAKSADALVKSDETPPGAALKTSKTRGTKQASPGRRKLSTKSRKAPRKKSRSGIIKKSPL